ncbi:MAG: tetratricopeptide repeat protein [Verrucomicrobiales bacterium]|nr:tetratricopeptide repeat protein [Verrucomicrobiales bacterium]
MKFYAALAVFLLVVSLSSARAQQEADDQYIFIYSLIQQADTLAGSGRLQPALTQYTEVQGELQKFQKVFPDWNPKIVSFRLKYLAGKIAAVTAQLPAPVAAPPVAAVTNARPSSPPAPGIADDLRGQIQSLQAVNATLQAKLKEALAAQPATIDSRELTKAQEKIQALMKENELLKVSLSQGKTRTNIVNVAAQTDELKRAQSALTEANQKLSEQIARADKLAQDNQSLQTRLQALLASPAALDALRAENALLKKQLADLKNAATNSFTSDAQLDAGLKQARLQIATLQSDAQVRQLEKTALENRLNRFSAAAGAGQPVPAPSADQVKNEARIRELTQERNDLLAKLGAANRDLYGAKKQSAAAQIGDLNDQIKTLRARLAVDEALAVPYTAEELALFRQAAPQFAGLDTEKKSIKELPEGSGQLVAEAQKFFAAKQYDKAGDNYQKILQRDENNSIVLGNLAAIEMEQGKLDDAEKHLTTAVAQNPDDAFNLSMLGYLKFRQEKYDDALNALGRAAKLDPQNPEIQNFLGVTLGHKGLRVQAETALRKAVQLAPDYAAAHNNLAVIYINQQPPLVQLARWHYEKALAAGQPPNPDLEKALGGTFAPANSK